MYEINIVQGDVAIIWRPDSLVEIRLPKEFVANLFGSLISNDINTLIIQQKWLFIKLADGNVIIAIVNLHLSVFLWLQFNEQL